MPTPSARGASRNTPGPMRNMATRCPIRSMPSTLAIRRARLDRRATPAQARSGWRWCGSCSRSAARRSCRDWRARASARPHAADNGLLTAHWRMGDGATLRLIANLSRQDIAHASDATRAPRSGAASPATGFRPGRCSGASEARRCLRPFRSRPIACSSPRISTSTTAAAVVPYLKALGITHLYASPFMKARKG